MPSYDEFWFKELDTKEWGLVLVPHVDRYKGFVFGNLDPDAPPLLDYLGDMAWYLDLMLDRHPDGTELIAGVHKWAVNANWKFAAENFVGDMYHGGLTHASAFQAGFGGGSNAHDRAGRPTQLGYQIALPGGHGLGSGWWPDGAAPIGSVAEVADYRAYRLPEAVFISEDEGPLLDLYTSVSWNNWKPLSWERILGT